MPDCRKIRTKLRRVCTGDLRDPITLQNRDITAPTSTVDYTLAFNPIDTETTDPNEEGRVWAAIETVRGEEIFDGHDLVEVPTHKIYVRALDVIDLITAETWVLLDDGTRLRIQDIENLEERGEYLLLRCTHRGTDQQSNNAV